MKSASKKRAPTIVNLTVKWRYLTEREVERLMDCARKHGRYGHRDPTMILVAYRHGRPSRPRASQHSRGFACAAIAPSFVAAESRQACCFSRRSTQSCAGALLIGNRAYNLSVRDHRR
jgi:hypothetical protein